MAAKFQMLFSLMEFFNFVYNVGNFVDRWSNLLWIIITFIRYMTSPVQMSTALVFLDRQRQIQVQNSKMLPIPNVVNYRISSCHVLFYVV